MASSASISATARPRDSPTARTSPTSTSASTARSTPWPARPSPSSTPTACPCCAPSPTQPAVNISDYSAYDGNSGLTAFQFPVTLSVPNTNNVNVQFTVTSGTATVGSQAAGGDIQTTSGTATVLAGQTTGYATVY